MMDGQDSDGLQHKSFYSSLSQQDYKYMTLTDGVWELSDEHMLVFVIGHQVALLELPDVGMYWRCVRHQRLTTNAS